jgi:hypothetical protein
LGKGFSGIDAISYQLLTRPPEVAAFKPLSTNRQFTVSFHIETAGDKKPETNFPDKV